MKTITMLTSEESFYNNYGAALQGYALYTILKEMGLSPKVIRYRGGEARNSQIEYHLFQIKRAIGKLYRSIKGTKKEALSRDTLDKIERREKMFHSFIQNNLSFWNEERISWQQLRKVYPDSDYYICGSDQIWNPYFKSGYNDPGYFLAFAPKTATKIAYAPSFGCDDIPKTAKKTLPTLLDDFDAISVREQSGVDIIKKYTNRKAEHVLDPTLLRTEEQWRQIARKPEKLPPNYILSYRFAKSDKTKKIIDQISNITGWPIISLPLSEIALKDNYDSVFEAGPQEFVGLIDNASLVCTDSFHATVFSIILKTPVCVFLRESYENGNSMNSRVYSLLKMLELDSLIMAPDTSLEEAIKCLQIDYAHAHELLKKEREKSIQFLKKAFLSD